MGAKWVELLMEIAPGIRSITAIFDPDTSPSRMFLPSVEASLKALGAELSVPPVRNEKRNLNCHCGSRQQAVQRIACSA